MVRIRMSRIGRVHRPFFRISAIDQRTKRNGKVIEPLGWYDPIAKDEAKQINLNTERVKHWLSVGAQPSDTVMNILIKMELVGGEQVKAWKARHAARVAAKQKAPPAAPVKKAG